MSKKTLILVAILFLLAVLGGVLAYRSGVLRQPEEMNQENRNKQGESKKSEEVTGEKPIDIVQTVESIDTSNWKTYRNEEYGFEFKYPETWEMRKGIDEDNIGTQFLFSERGKLYDYEGSKVDAIILSVNLKDNPKLVSIDKLLEIWGKEYHVQTREFIVDNHLIATYYTGFGEGVLIDSIPGKNYELSLSSPVTGESGVRGMLIEMGKSIHFLEN